MPSEPHDQSKLELHRWCIDLLEDGQDQRKAWEGVWWENIATYLGDLWVEWNVHTKRLSEPVKPDYKVRLPVNLAQPVVRTELAKLTKNRPILDVLARSNEKTDLNAAEVGDKLLNNYVERKFHMARVRRRALMWVLTCGYGGVFVDYDEEGVGKVDVWVDPQGMPLADPRVIEGYQEYYRKKKKAPRKDQLQQGELVFKSLGPWNVLFDYSQLFIEDAWWCIVSDVYDVIDVERRWGKRPEKEDVSPGTIEQRMMGRFDLTGKLNAKGVDSQELCQVHRLFVKPGHPYFERGAHVVFTKDEIVRDEEFPFGHGQLPVGMMGHVPLPISKYPLSVLQQIKPVVLELSRTASQLVENRNVMANPPWMIATQHRIDKPIQNRPGTRIKYTHVPNVPEPHPVQMPEIPNYVRELIPEMREHILEISGQGETSQGRVPPGARSGVAIAYLQEEDDTRLGPTVTEFEEMMERVANLTLDTIAEKYDVMRTIVIHGRRGEPEVFDFMGSMLRGTTGVVCQAGSALPRSKAAKQQFVLDLWDRKLEQDPRRVREMLELSEGDPDEWEIDMDQAERENRKLMAGQDVEVYEWHNHPAHHYTHRRFMKSADFEQLPPAVQQLFLSHDADHTAFEEQEKSRLMEEQARMGAMGGQGASVNPSMNGTTPVEPGANGQQVPEGPPAEFSADIAPRDLLSDQPQ